MRAVAPALLRLTRSAAALLLCVVTVSTRASIAAPPWGGDSPQLGTKSDANSHSKSVDAASVEPVAFQQPAESTSPDVRIPDSAPDDMDESLFAQTVSRLYGRADYLFVWTKGSATPPLVTTSPDSTPRSQSGVLPAATVLFGGDQLDATRRDGLRAVLGGWLDDEQQTGLEGSYFGFGEPAANSSFFAESLGLPQLARPFFNMDSGQDDAELVAFPAVLAGSVAVFTDSQLQTAALTLRRATRAGPIGRLDLLVGYRFLQFREGLMIREDLVSTDPGGLVEIGTRIVVEDQFSTRNEFHGADLGLALTLERGIWVFESAARVGIGEMRERLITRGATTVTTPGDLPVTGVGGLLVLPSNLVDLERRQLAFLPQFDLTCGCQVTEALKVNVGYSLLVLTQAARAGEQVDLRVDPSQLPFGAGGGAGSYPQAAFSDSALWVQGLSLGLEWRR